MWFTYRFGLFIQVEFNMNALKTILDWKIQANFHFEQPELKWPHYSLINRKSIITCPGPCPVVCRYPRWWQSRRTSQPMTGPGRVVVALAMARWVGNALWCTPGCLLVKMKTFYYYYHHSHSLHFNNHQRYEFFYENEPLQVMIAFSAT